MQNSFFNAAEEDITDFDILQEKRILVVDDNEDMLVLITYVLENYGIKVITTSSAADALQIIKTCEIDLLITDIAMPEEDGISLLQNMRKLTEQQKREIPAIAFTGSVEDQVRRKTLTTEFQAYIRKPSDPIHLIAEVAKLLKSTTENSSLSFSNYSYLKQEKVA